MTLKPLSLRSPNAGFCVLWLCKKGVKLWRYTCAREGVVSPNLCGAIRICIVIIKQRQTIQMRQHQATHKKNEKRECWWWGRWLYVVPMEPQHPPHTFLTVYISLLCIYISYSLQLVGWFCLHFVWMNENEIFVLLPLNARIVWSYMHNVCVYGVSKCYVLVSAQPHNCLFGNVSVFFFCHRKAKLHKYIFREQSDRGLHEWRSNQDRSTSSESTCHPMPWPR